MRSHLPDTITPVIWDPDADAILARSNSRERTLPTLAASDADFGASLPGSIQNTFGLTTILLENLDKAVYVVALRNPPASATPGYEWVSATESGLSTPDDFWVSRWLAHRDSPLRPWFEQGWIDRALAFIDAVLADLGRARIGQVSQIKHWSLSSVMRVETTKGAVFFKAAPSEEAIEPLLLARLGTRWPMSVPKVLAHSPQDNWWITDDFGTPKGTALSPEDRLACIELLARMQIETATDDSILRGLPITTYSQEHLAASVPAILERLDRWDATPAAHEHWRPLSAVQRDTWCSLGPKLVECIHALETSMSALGLPSSLIHGDFHFGNMAMRDDIPILHDWANGMVTHPFFDLAMLLDSCDNDLAQRCLTAYFGPWHQAGWKMSDLQIHWQVVKPVSALFEIDRALQQCDSLGESHQFTMISVLYGWIRRLLGAVLDGSSPTFAWSTSGIAAKQ